MCIRDRRAVVGVGQAGARVRVGAHTHRDVVLPEVVHPVRDHQAVVVDGVADRHPQRRRPAGLFSHVDLQRHQGTGVLDNLPRHPPDQPVDGVAPGRLGDLQLLRPAAQLPAPARGPVGPRRQHHARAHRGLLVGREGLQVGHAAHLEGAQTGADLGDHRSRRVVRDLQLLASGAAHERSLERSRRNPVISRAGPRSHRLRGIRQCGEG